MKKDTSWGGVANWYDELLTKDSESFQAKVILPNLTRLLSIKKGEKILDLACGQGYFAREWSTLGAEVVGVDISSELIELAKKKKGEVEYHVSAADDLSMIADGSVDKITMILALQNIDNVAGVCKEVARVLKPDGVWSVVMNHPAFRVPKHSSWHYDDEGNQYRRIDKYLSESKVKIQMHPGDDPSSTTVSFHRPLQFYFKVLSKAGLCVGRLEEWTSHKVSDSGPKAEAENVARKEIPLFMCLMIPKHPKT